MMKRDKNPTPLSKKQKNVSKVIVGILILIFALAALNSYLPKPGDKERKAERQEAYDKQDEVRRAEYIEWYPSHNETLHAAYDRYMEQRSSGYEARKTEGIYQLQESLEEVVNQKIPTDKSDLFTGGYSLKKKSKDLLDIINGSIRREVSDNRLDSEITAFFLNIESDEELIENDLEY